MGTSPKMTVLKCSLAKYVTVWSKRPIMNALIVVQCSKKRKKKLLKFQNVVLPSEAVHQVLRKAVHPKKSGPPGPRSIERRSTKEERSTRSLKQVPPRRRSPKRRSTAGPSKGGPRSFKGGPPKKSGPPGPSKGGPSGPSKGGPPKKSGPPGPSKGGPPKGGPSGPKRGPPR